MAVRWLPNKDTQIRGKYWLKRPSTWQFRVTAHCHTDDNLRRPVTALAGWHHGGRSQSGGEGEDGICSQTITLIAGAASQTGAGVASADGLCQPCSAGSRQSRQATRRSLAPPAFPHAVWWSVYMGSLSSWSLRTAFFFFAFLFWLIGGESLTHTLGCAGMLTRQSIQRFFFFFSLVISSHQAMLTWLID